MRSTTKRKTFIEPSKEERMRGPGAYVGVLGCQQYTSFNVAKSRDHFSSAFKSSTKRDPKPLSQFTLPSERFGPATATMLAQSLVSSGTPAPDKQGESSLNS